MEGVVIKSTGSWYEVEFSSGKRLKARLKGKIRIKGLKSTNPLAVGDRVVCEEEGTEGIISAILPRKNYIIRKSIKLSKQVQIIAANVDQVFLMVTLKAPKTHLAFVDRFLVGAEAFRIPVVLLFNKMDLLNQADLKELESWKTIYAAANYRQMEVSAKNREGIDSLKSLMKGKVSIFSGHSGVGKSTLINQLDANLKLQVNSISKAHQSGKHTTTFAEIHSLDFGGKVIDTPGIKGFGNVELEKNHLSHYFPEMRSRLNQCKFHNCIHINEPDCAVKDAVAKGEIPKSRYNNYVSMFEEDEEESYRQKGY